jgi:hypothetical protein
MNTLKRARHSRRGSATLVVLGIIALIAALLAVMSNAANNRLFMARKLTDQVRALMYAEAGAHEAYARLQNDWSLRTNAAAFPPTSYDLGSFDVTVTTVTNGVALLQSVGICRDAEVEVVLDLQMATVGGSGGSTNPVDDAFSYGMVCGGELNFGGCGDISGTNGTTLMHANGLMHLRGNASADLDISSSMEIRINNNVTIDGDVTAPDLQYQASKVTITGTASEEAVDMVDIPDIDLTPYYNWALEHGEVHNGFSFGGTSYDANGGIIWVNGNVSISSHAVINGSIIATGDIQTSGQCEVNPTTCAFGLASRDGDIKNTSSGVIRGLIYTKVGDFEMPANGQLEGQAIVHGDIRKTGCSGVILFREYIPQNPYGTDPVPGTDVVTVSAWQK